MLLAIQEKLSNSVITIMDDDALHSNRCLRIVHNLHAEASRVAPNHTIGRNAVAKLIPPDLGFGRCHHVSFLSFELIEV